MLCGAVLLFLLLPIIVIIPLSFSNSSFLSYPIPGWSLRWYQELFASDDWARATLIATTLGTLAAVGLARAQFFGKGLLTSLLIAPMVVPIVVVGVSTLLQGNKVWQIGLRGTGYGMDDFDWPRQQGFTVVQAHEVWYQSLAPLMARVRESIGQAPCYLSFDIDGIDPSFAGGTGTPEIGGLSVPQALEIIRGCRGLNLVGADLVEVSPPYDTSGNTALLGANLLYEMLCVLPGVHYR